METTASEKVHCLIIGSGPAGYTAAIYAARANLKPVLYQGIQPGGQLTITTDVENYPGYPEGIQGPEMIVATVASSKWLGLESEQRLNGYRVSACAVCDGFFFRGKEVAIVGAGDTAAEEALYLAKLATTVHMFIRKHEMRASKVMQERVFKSPNIKIYWNTEVEEIIGNGRVESVRVLNNKTGELKEISVSGFFVAIGHQPNSEIFKSFVDMDD